MLPPEVRSGDDSYIVWRTIENFGAQGGEGTFWIAPLPPHEVVEAKVYFYVGDIAGERLVNQTLSALDDIGSDATSLASAQDSLGIVVPVEIVHNDLAGRDSATAHPASAVTVTPAGGIASTDVAAALNELDTDKEAAGTAAAAITAHEGDATAHPASSITFTPVGTIAATDAQAAIAEVATDAASALSSEASTRSTADTTLQGNIDDEAAARATADSNHVAAADPHTQYQKESEKDAANGYLGADANARLTSTKLQVSATDRLIGRDTASAGASEELTVGGGVEFTGTGGIQRSALTGDVTASAGSGATTIAAKAVSLSKMADIATDKLLGRDTAGTGVPETLGVSGGIEFTGRGGIQTSAFTGDVTKAAGGTALTIADDAVTYAKMQNVSATDKVLGRSTAGSGDVEEIACTSTGRSVISASSVQAVCANLTTWWIAGRLTQQVSNTATTSEEALLTVTIPAGAIGPNGIVRVTVQYDTNSSANSKTFKIYHNSSATIGGTNIWNASHTASLGARSSREFVNQNSASSQRYHSAGADTGTGAGSGTGTGSIDTANTSYIIVTGKKASAGDTLTLSFAIVEIAYGA